MDNNYDGNLENQEMTDAGSGAGAQEAETGSMQADNGQDAENAGDISYTQADSQQGGNTQQEAGPSGANSYQQQYQDNFNYNVQNHTTGYGQSYEDDNAPMSMGEWVLMLLLMAIPCVNIVMCCVWAFGKDGNVNRRNFCRAKLIFFGIGVLCFIIVLAIILVVALGAGRGSYYYY